MPTSKHRDLSRSKQLAKLIQRRMRRRLLGGLVALAIIAVAIIVPLTVVPGALRTLQKVRGEAEEASRPPKRPPAILFVDATRTLQIAQERWAELGLHLEAISNAPAGRGISLDGILYIDPEDYVAVRSRFAGEFVDVAEVLESGLPGNAIDRSIRFGDVVKKGQFLGAVWSRELGEKKSELAQCVSSLKYDRETLARLLNAANSIPTAQIREAERRVRDSEITVERIEKTLRSWQLSQAEIQSILDEIGRETGQSLSSDGLSKTQIDNWARVEMRSPIDGTLIEKNVTVGGMVDLEEVLFKVANLEHLDVRAFAYEEDIAAIQRLATDQRSWTIQLKSEADSPPIHGVFDRIGGLIDPVQHTGLVMGWVDNGQGMLRPGQFVTASIVIPDSDPLIRLPSSSIVEFDGNSYVLVSSAETAGTFHCVEVDVVRYEMHDACVRPHTLEGDVGVLSSGMMVVATAAMEIFTEYRLHLSTLPSEPANSQLGPTAPPMNSMTADEGTTR